MRLSRLIRRDDMSYRTTENLKALISLQDRILELFRTCDYLRVAPEIIQPADAFLGQSGEVMRQRTYVFTDHLGTELCLRPDVTIPACRIYLKRCPDADQLVRYCYTGPAFRFQNEDAGQGRPREFEQAGIELLGHEDKEAAEAEVLSLGIKALEAADITEFTIKFGDLSLFSSLIDGFDMPERWRIRLKHQFWRHDALEGLLDQLAGVKKLSAGLYDEALLKQLGGCDRKQATAVVDSYLAEKNIPVVGRRNVEDIAGRLLDHVADIAAEPLDADIIATIRKYLAINGSPHEAQTGIEAIARAAGLDLSQTLGAFQRRLDLFKDHNINLDRAIFSAEFGRNLEYYTGFVFQLEVPHLGVAGQLAGGGRYDNLLGGLGAPRTVPAVGCAIHLDRLLNCTNASGAL